MQITLLQTKLNIIKYLEKSTIHYNFIPRNKLRFGLATGFGLIFIYLAGCNHSKTTTAPVVPPTAGANQKLSAQSNQYIIKLPPISQFKYGSSDRNGTRSITNGHGLQSYTLHQLKLAGIVNINDRLTAYLITPDSALIPATIGTLIGNKAKVITKITVNQVIVDYPANNPQFKGKSQPEILSLEDTIQ